MTKSIPIPTGTKCVLCGKKKEEGKRYNRHHISYKYDVTIILCYTCHSIVHGRLRWGNPWDLKYGKDKGFYKLAKKFVMVYDCILQSIVNNLQTASFK